MRPEESERLLIEELFSNTQSRIADLTNMKIEKVNKLTGDASTRRYYRVHTNKGSFVSCLSESKEDEEHSDFLNVYKVLNRFNVRVPTIHDLNITKGYFLQEDLGDVTFLSYVTKLTCDEEIFETYKKVINTLIEIHKIPVDKKFNWGKLEFDVEKYMSEMNFTNKFFFNCFLQNPLSLDEEKVYSSQLNKLVKELSETSKVLSHRDFHSRNIMVKSEDFVVIDFQDARQGIAQYDLVSMLEDCYFQLTDDNIKKLKEYYFKHSPSIDQSQEQFDRLYDLMTIQRVLKAIGSFSYIYETRKDIRYVKYIGYGFEKVRNKLKKYPEYLELYNLLIGKYYES
ncbi:hypothetical protein A9Q84_20465 [Halobacteriovorax marinus]|uniref:Aminoglycoside phosphotransferase domain-containing protein n=1 Tax=Halobacteriovorax marinus TaxID=97084 RepID=A0A1Y5F161_9BACT|nr:hypothetical protein A9Q84_20465 [Halobacteriovorax marinus]